MGIYDIYQIDSALVDIKIEVSKIKNISPMCQLQWLSIK